MTVPNSEYMPMPPTTDPNAKKSKKPLIIIISCVVLVAVVLAIVLPLTMCNNQNSPEKAAIAYFKSLYAQDYNTYTKLVYEANFSNAYSREEYRQNTEKNHGLDQYKDRYISDLKVKEVENVSEDGIEKFKSFASDRFKDVDKVTEMKRVTVEYTISDGKGRTQPTGSTRGLVKCGDKWYILPVDFTFM